LSACGSFRLVHPFACNDPSRQARRARQPDVHQDSPPVCVSEGAQALTGPGRHSCAGRRRLVYARRLLGKEATFVVTRISRLLPQYQAEREAANANASVLGPYPPRPAAQGPCDMPVTAAGATCRETLPARTAAANEDGLTCTIERNAITQSKVRHAVRMCGPSRSRTPCMPRPHWPKTCHCPRPPALTRLLVVSCRRTTTFCLRKRPLRRQRPCAPALPACTTTRRRQPALCPRAATLPLRPARPRAQRPW
jgi:hypothetical protein